ncbi:hypothetical protein BU23DRAFT_600932 [Bimuria novae-zelandiae CBS 107.79]|uniref:Uncharacterized protein n=1 Tax=Bimuria novae-zelandiae CBS 107.79 TaxID=1447943 RepID=A0A6A5V288_9PLEO|nr:hypothetical protein BU23DRAFT_600932 [Bimuria novae-zelandiae CBS 107.79]
MYENVATYHRITEILSPNIASPKDFRVPPCKLGEFPSDEPYIEYDGKEIETAILKTYLHWLEHGTVPRPCIQPHEQDFPFLAKLYVLGEEFSDVECKNAVVDTIIAVVVKTKRCPIGGATNIIYAGTKEGSPARHLLVELFAQNVYIGRTCGRTWMDEFKECPHEFLVDAMKALDETRGKPQYRPYPGIDVHTSYHG